MNGKFKSMQQKLTSVGKDLIRQIPYHKKKKSTALTPSNPLEEDALHNQIDNE